MSNASNISELEKAEHVPAGAGVGAKRISGYETDGINLVQKTSSIVAKKITVSGANTYVAIAPIGTSQASALWQVKKINVTGGDTVITWAGGGAFNQVATDLTSLTYL